MAKTILKWISNIISILMLILLVILLYYTIASKANGGKPNIMGVEFLTVLSGSMEPGIPTGSIIGVKPVDDPSTLQVGDVITFKASDSGDMLITHRIIEIVQEGNSIKFITQGDNNDAPDPDPVLASQVVAKYQKIVIPYLGYLFSYANTKTGIVLLMIVPGAILILSQLISVWKMIANMDDGDEKKKSEESVAMLDETSTKTGENFS